MEAKETNPGNQYGQLGFGPSGDLWENLWNISSSGQDLKGEETGVLLYQLLLAVVVHRDANS